MTGREVETVASGTGILEPEACTAHLREGREPEATKGTKKTVIGGENDTLGDTALL